MFLLQHPRNGAPWYDLSHRFHPRGTRSIFPRDSFSLSPPPASGPNVNRSTERGFAHDVSSVREPRECAYIRWQTRPPESETSPPTRTFSSHSLRSMKCKEYSVFGPRSPTRVVRFQSVRYCEGRRDGSLNAFGEVATVRITRHPFCKLSTHLSLSLSLSVFSHSLPASLVLSFFSSSLFFSVFLCVSPYPLSRGYNGPKTKRAKSLALIS